MSTESGMVLVPSRSLELLYAVYHAAWHARDDGEPVEEGDSPRSIIECEKLDAALDAVDEEITCPSENVHHLMEQFTATPQTQATHGEGEAALQWRWRTHEHAGPWNDGLPPEGEEAKRGGYKDWIEYRFVGALHVIEKSMRAAAPSPTAAPALGELAKALLDHANVYPLDMHSKGARAWVACSMVLHRRAADALSGVAAQAATKGPRP